MKQRKYWLAKGLLLLVLCFTTSCNKPSSAIKQQYDAGIEAIKTNHGKGAIDNLLAAEIEPSGKKDLKKSDSIWNKKVFYALGIAYDMEGDYKTAISYFNQALEIPYQTDWNTDINQYLADALYKDGDYEKALTVFSVLTKQSPEDFSLLFRKVFTLEELGQLEEKEKVLEQALTIKGSGDTHAFNLAKVNFYLGNTSEATDGMKKAAKAGISEALFYLGQLAEEEENYEAAISYYQAYKETQATVDDILMYHMVAAYAGQEQYKKAITLSKEAIKKSDGTLKKELSYQLVILYEKTAQYKKAWKACKAYLEIAPNDDTMKKEYEFLKSRIKEKE